MLQDPVGVVFHGLGEETSDWKFLSRGGPKAVKVDATLSIPHYSLQSTVACEPLPWDVAVNISAALARKQLKRLLQLEAFLRIPKMARRHELVSLTTIS